MGNTKETKLILLGGYDLEMMTIKQMFEGINGYVVADKHLTWSNALLSAYQQEINDFPNYDIYGIELKEDIPLPDRYHRIDHHNDFSSILLQRKRFSLACDHRVIVNHCSAILSFRS